MDARWCCFTHHRLLAAVVTWLDGPSLYSLWSDQPGCGVDKDLKATCNLYFFHSQNPAALHPAIQPSKSWLSFILSYLLVTVYYTLCQLSVFPGPTFGLTAAALEGLLFWFEPKPRAKVSSFEKSVRLNYSVCLLSYWKMNSRNLSKNETSWDLISFLIKQKYCWGSKQMC